MLQTTKSSPIADPVSASADVASPAELFSSFQTFLYRQYPIVLFVVLLVMALATVYLFTTPPSFTATAKLIIDTHKIQLFQQQSMLGDLPVDSSTVDSQVEILKSENVSLSVIKELHLTEDPEFTGPSSGLIGAIRGFIDGLFASSEPASEFGLTRRALNVFENQVDVKRVGMTYVIDINFRSLNAERAGQIANAIADAYIVDQLESKYQATRRASIWLQDRIKELREQATTAERAVVDFKTKNNIVDTGGRLMNEQQLAELNSALVQSRAQTAEAKARLERIDDIMRMEVPDATVTDTLRNEVITKLRNTYLEYKRKEAEWSMRYGQNHLAAVNMRNQMAELRRSIVDELGRIAQSYRSDYEIAKAREDSVSQSLSDIVSQSQTTNQAQIALRELESSAQTYRALHDNFLQRYMESVQQQSFPVTEARLITQASRPLRKSHPKTVLILAIAAAGGAILGFGIGMLRDISDRVFRTSNQIESALETDCISVVPLVKADLTKSRPERTISDVRPGPRTIKRDDSVLWAVVDTPFSRFAEAIRAIKVAADLSKPGQSAKVIGVTSSLPNEGKSTIAMALAELIAQSGSRVVLVDCDLRNPALSRKLAPNATAGVLEAIANKTPLDQIFWTDASTKLVFLPSVVKSKFAHTSDVLAAHATKSLFDTLGEAFDYVVVDLSPMAPVVDVRAMTHLVDSFVFVVEWGRTKIDVVEHALRTSRGVYENLLGVVLNKANFNVLGRYEGYRGNYYHNRYYARYGYSE
jgi:succinoglycan biosynthesis transport protein ExoP